jgi:hypothetical protein
MIVEPDDAGLDGGEQTSAPVEESADGARPSMDK